MAVPLFTHLHVHTEYSMLDGLSRIDPLVRRAKELGMDSLAITDHGGLYGAIAFYQAAIAAGVKPIIGCEMYVAPGSRHDRNPSEKSPYHLTVLAKDAVGYRNLVKLVTKSHVEGFYYKPRVDREVLQEHSRGLVVLSGCPSAEVPRLLGQERFGEAQAVARWYRDVFDDYYLELMGHDDVPERGAINKGLFELNRADGVPMVVTNDSHYVNREDAPLQDILICIHTNTNVKDERRMKMSADSYYLKGPEEMAGLFPDAPEAAANTLAIAEKCDLELDFSQLRLPEFPVPEGGTADEYLARVCEEGLRRRLGRVTDRERERLDYELEVIKHTQFANYFLVVWDIARFVRERDIFFAVRGSAAASLVLYCLGVTDVNPLPYGLVFERFLNLERKEMPDIDMDFQDDRREEVINYVVDRYGRDKVAQIITFGTLGARASIRDVGRALAMPYADVDTIARLIPSKLHITLDEAMQESPELQEMYGAGPEVKNLVDTAKALEGLTRHSSTHAAGLVISSEPLDDVVPLQKPIKATEESVHMTQYPMDPIAALGLLKMDFLGLVNLTILAKARDLIAKTRGADLALRDIPLDDAGTFDLLSRGDTVGVFQLEGAGMTRYIKELKPSSLGDVAAMIALYRPGPMEHITTFIDAKHGRTAPHYPHPALREILEETYGVIVYQDQVLHIARTFAGYTLGEADIVRKAMGKKIPEIMAQEREKFMAGALAQGFDEGLADQVFRLIEPFAGYAFNKAHSVSYGLISYWTAYLKANYQAEYMVALLNSYIDNTDKIAAAVEECRRLDMPVHPPDVTTGSVEFSIEPSPDGSPAIRFGLSAVKNVGVGAVQPFREAVEKGKCIDSIEQMCREVDLSGFGRKPLESLIRAGAMDRFGDRSALLAVVDRILSLAQSEARLRDSGQTTMFDLFGETVPTPLASIELDDVTTPDREKWAWERELLGVSIAQGPALTVESDGDAEAVAQAGQLRSDMNGRRVVLAGQVSGVAERSTRDQRPFLVVTLDVMDGPVEVLVWQNMIGETRALWEEGSLVVVTGRVRARGDDVSISCDGAHRYDGADDVEPAAPAVEIDRPAARPVAPAGAPAGSSNGNASPQPAAPAASPAAEPENGAGGPAGGLRRLSLRLRESDKPADDQMLLEDMRRLLMEYRGDDLVELVIATDGRVVFMDWPLVRVDACAELEHRLRDLLGQSGTVSVSDVA